MEKEEQKCNTCRYLHKCWGEKVSPRNIILNILACRIRKDINREQSSKIFLEMIRPKLLKLLDNARKIVGNGYIDINTIMMDLESRVIECLLDSENGYNIGGQSYLTVYLFGSNPRTGWVRKWILWNFSKQQKFYDRHISYGYIPSSDTEIENSTFNIKDSKRFLSPYDKLSIIEVEEENINKIDSDNNNAVEEIMNIIEDGYTLNANEYRVLSFCLNHTNESNKSRLIDGTHKYLAKIMGVSRPRITRLYLMGRTKTIRAAKERGIEL